MFSERPLRRLLFSGLLSITFLLVFSGCDTSSTQGILYLGWDDNREEQLFHFDGYESRALTSFDKGIHDYAHSPDGRNIVLSTLDDDGDAELWLMGNDGFRKTLLHTCDLAEWANFAWTPDSRRLLFEQRDLGSDGIAGAPVLWWLDTQTATVLPLQEDVNLHGANARFSPDGQWLSYFSPEKEGLSIYNLETGASQFITNEIGADVAWSPDSEQLVVPQLDLVISHGEEGDDHQDHEHDYQTAVHLLHLDVKTGAQQTISGDLQVEDSVPAWSPDGKWIAFGRRATGSGAARQLWIMRPDGTGARALSDDPVINHGPPIWAADGRTLIFQQITQDDLVSDPGIWKIDIETGEKEELISSGMQPAWLPSRG